MSPDMQKKKLVALNDQLLAFLKAWLADYALALWISWGSMAILADCGLARLAWNPRGFFVGFEASGYAWNGPYTFEDVHNAHPWLVESTLVAMYPISRMEKQPEPVHA